MDKYNHAAHQLKYNIKRSNKHCVVCGDKIPYGSRRFRLCSDKCKRIRVNNRLREYRLKCQDIFHEWKLLKGCSSCGYKLCPASLDLHHVDGGKESRITAKSLKAMNKKTKKEIDKCIILCKNCHYEAHFVMNNPGHRLIAAIKSRYGGKK